MRHLSGLLARSALLAFGAACATSSRATSHEPRPGGDTITRSQIEQRNFRTALEAVQALHANWLRTRGVDSFNSPTPIWVYLDESRVGGLDALRFITPRSVAVIRRYDGLQAAARWGLGHSQGVIHVETWAGVEPRGEEVSVRESPPSADSTKTPKP
jgi:hypothetical protein